MTRSTGMNKSAPFGVFLTLLIAHVAGCATGDMARTPLVAPSPVYAQDEVTYEYQWLAGKAVIIAAAGLVKVTALLIPIKSC